MTTTNNIIQEMKTFYQWSEGTVRQYKFILRDYEKHTNQTIYNLILEAETDEENISKVSRRCIKNRMYGYMEHLRERGLKEATIKEYIHKIAHVYHYHEITTPKLPPLKQENNETFQELPTEEMIQKAMNNTNTRMKALISFIASTGLRRSDVAALTIQDFVDATVEYHDGRVFDVSDLLKHLEGRDDIVPSWDIVSVKTGINHLCFSSTESSMFILQMLRENWMKRFVGLDESLFGLQSNSITLSFSRLNDRLGFGWKDTRRRFHPHALRKFFATTLNANDVDYLASEFLIGHKLKSVDSSYYFANQERLKIKYMRVMEHLCFVTRVSYSELSSGDLRELERLRNENLEIKARLAELDEREKVIDELRKGLNELNFDKLRSINDG